MHPLDALLAAAGEVDGSENGLARQRSIYLAQSMSVTMQNEEEEKKKLVEDSKAQMLEKVDEMFTLE